MDKFRIQYICNKRPDKWIHLIGFEEGLKYSGRMFNGLYEISPDWGSDTPTKMINQKTFDSFFEMVN